MPSPQLRLVMALSLAASATCPAAAATEGGWPDPATSHSESMPDAARSLLLDAVQLSGGRTVAVGERGHVLLSDDDGESWRQVVVPTRVTLTAVATGGDAVVAAGHDGVILHSTDRGETWQRVREEPYSADNFASPSNGSPVLDVLFLDRDRALAIGAYALVLTSSDGGATWQSGELALAADSDAGNSADDGTGDATDAAAVTDDGTDVAQEDEIEADASGGAGDGVLFDADELMLDDEVDPHLNAVARTVGGALVMVGERGSVFRSRDDGATWQRVALPYGGSMFGVLPTGGDGVLVMGLRGRAFETGDLGDSWREIDTGVAATLFDGYMGADRAVVLVGAQGAIVRRPSAIDGFEPSVYVTEGGETPTHSAVLQREDGGLLLFGERGAAQWRRP
jgi:photosystem II stability/assembly factor-like uncharacterized protein